MIYSTIINNCDNDIKKLEKNYIIALENKDIEKVNTIINELNRVNKRKDFIINQQKESIEKWNEENKKRKYLYGDNNTNFKTNLITPTIIFGLLSGGIFGMIIIGGSYLIYNKSTENMDENDIINNYKVYLSNFNKNDSIKSHSYLSNFRKK